MANAFLNYYTVSFEVGADGIVSIDKDAIKNKLAELGYIPATPSHLDWQTTFDGKTLFVVIPLSEKHITKIAT